MAAKKSVAKRERVRAVAPVESKPAEKPLKPGQCRGYMRTKLAEAFPGIVDGFVKEAKAGSCAHVKLANELLEKPAGRVARRKNSAEMALRKLGRG